MRTRRISKICAWSLGVFFFWTVPACTQSPSTSQIQAERLTRQEIIQELVKANVVYLGENHDRAEDHKAQLEILQALHQQKLKNGRGATTPRIAIAMEMFQRPFQNVLDQYLAGKITEAQLIEQSQYDQRWSFPWEYYAPILRFAKANQLPVLALNTPTEVTRKVARSGLESLTTAERKYIPPLSEIRTDNAQYREMARKAYELHHQAGHGNSRSFERFFTAQVLWDETMAQTIAQFLKANRDYQVVVLAGETHIVYGYGIPSRVARRLNSDRLVQRSVLFNASDREASANNLAARSPEAQLPQGNKAADFVWDSKID
jgi:uncharacterized iron-regulated protein